MEVPPGREALFNRWQKPQYMRAPPNIPPNGPFALGTIVKEIDFYRVLNRGSSRVPVTDSYPDVTTGIEVRVSSSSSHGTKILGEFLDHTLGANIGLQGAKSSTNSYTIQKLETISFDPTEEYISNCRELPDIKAYLDYHQYKKPIYLITGLKIVWGASFSVAHGQDSGQEAGAGVALGNEELNLEVKAEVSHGKNSAFEAITKGSKDFVLGLRLQKLYHKKNPLSGKVTAHDKPEIKNAVLMDADSGVKDKDDQLVPVEMDEEEAKKMVF